MLKVSNNIAATIEDLFTRSYHSCNLRSKSDFVSSTKSRFHKLDVIQYFCLLYSLIYNLNHIIMWGIFCHDLTTNKT